MPIVTWSEEYEVDVAEIDAQHQKMLDLVNHLHASVEARIDKNQLKKLLSELVSYTHMHFATEEALMDQYGFPDTARHKQEHSILLRHLNLLLDAVSQGKYPTFYSDYDVSTDWMLLHITDCDKPLGNYLKSKQVT